MLYRSSRVSHISEHAPDVQRISHRHVSRVSLPETNQTIERVLAEALEAAGVGVEPVSTPTSAIITKTTKEALILLVAAGSIGGYFNHLTGVLFTTGTIAANFELNWYFFRRYVNDIEAAIDSKAYRTMTTRDVKLLALRFLVSTAAAFPLICLSLPPDGVYDPLTLYMLVSASIVFVALLDQAFAPHFKKGFYPQEAEIDENHARLYDIILKNAQNQVKQYKKEQREHSLGGYTILPKLVNIEQIMKLDYRTYVDQHQALPTLLRIALKEIMTMHRTTNTSRCAQIGPGLAFGISMIGSVGYVWLSGTVLTQMFVMANIDISIAAPLAWALGMFSVGELSLLNIPGFSSLLKLARDTLGGYSSEAGFYSSKMTIVLQLITNILGAVSGGASASLTKAFCASLNWPSQSIETQSLTGAAEITAAALNLCGNQAVLTSAMMTYVSTLYPFFQGKEHKNATRVQLMTAIELFLRNPEAQEWLLDIWLPTRVLRHSHHSGHEDHHSPDAPKSSWVFNPAARGSSSAGSRSSHRSQTNPPIVELNTTPLQPTAPDRQQSRPDLNREGSLHNFFNLRPQPSGDGTGTLTTSLLDNEYTPFGDPVNRV